MVQRRGLAARHQSGYYNGGGAFTLTASKLPDSRLEHVW
jgi:hypothetical protein